MKQVSFRIALAILLSVFFSHTQVSFAESDSLVDRVNWAEKQHGASITGTGFWGGNAHVSELINDNIAHDKVSVVCVKDHILVDLGQQRTVDAVGMNLHVRNGDLDRSYKVRVEVSEDGKNFHQVVLDTVGSWDAYRLLDFPEESVRFVKISEAGSAAGVLCLEGRVFVVGTTPLDDVPSDLDITLDGSRAIGSSFRWGPTGASGQVHEIPAGIYSITYEEGGWSAWSGDDLNNGSTWLSTFNVFLPCILKGYAFNWLSFYHSTSPTVQEAEAKSFGHEYLIDVPFRTKVVFFLPDSVPNDNRGSIRLRVRQVSSSSNSLKTRIRDAMARGVLWEQSAVANWNVGGSSPLTNGCIGCHIQTQASRGLNESVRKISDLPVDPVFREERLLKFFQARLWNVLRGQPEERSLWGWAVSSFDNNQIEEVLADFALFAIGLTGEQGQDGSWGSSKGTPGPYSDGSPSLTFIANNLQTIARAIELASVNMRKPSQYARVNDSTVMLQGSSGLYTVSFSQQQKVTGFRIDGLDLSGNSIGYISEIVALGNGETKTIVSAVSTSNVNDLESTKRFFDGKIGTQQSVSVGILRGTATLFTFSKPVDIDEIKFISPSINDHYLKSFRLSFTVDTNPTFSSHFVPAQLQGVYDEMANFLIPPFLESITKGVDFILNRTVDLKRNTRTAAQAIIALYSVQNRLDPTRLAKAQATITELSSFLRNVQRVDGAWNDEPDSSTIKNPHTAATAMVLKALLFSAGNTLDEHLKRAAEFLLGSQFNDGSWRKWPYQSTLATTTWVQIALPVLYDLLIKDFSNLVINDVRAKGELEQVQVSWTPIEKAHSYNIYRHSDSTNWELVKRGHVSDIAVYNDEAVSTEVTYYYKVTWLDRQGLESADSNEASATPSGFACAMDTSPIISSVPITGASPNTDYSYDVEATDEDANDVLKFSLVAAPKGMSINGATGFISWRPTIDQTGSHVVRVRVDDRIGRFATQAYRVAVQTVFTNFPPKFVSKPTTSGVAGYPYRYQSYARDLNPSDTLRYSIESAPEGAEIDSAAGLVRWVPAVRDEGKSFDFVLIVRDTKGETDRQSFQVVVAQNKPPIIKSTPQLLATRTVSYAYQVTAEDPERGPLTYALVSAPSGAQIGRYGLITWRPGDGDIGVSSFTVEVKDSGGLTAQQDFNVTVPDNLSPVISSTPVTFGILNSLYSYQVKAEDPERDLLTYSVANGPEGLTISAFGMVSWRPGAVGDYSVTILASDPKGLSASQSYTIAVRDVAPGTLAIDSPQYGSSLRVPTEVVGSVTPPGNESLTSWTLEMRSLASGLVTRIAEGTTPIVKGKLGTIDTTKLASDLYDLVLTRTTNRSVLSTILPILIEGNMKFGNFTIAITDQSLPLPGVPIDITRVYDSFDLSKGDFGYGWRLNSFGRIVDSAPEEDSGAFFTGERVMVVLPGGRRSSFTFDPVDVPLFLIGGIWSQPVFNPGPGVTDTLEVEGAIKGAYLWGSGPYYSSDFKPYNPNRYYLTTRDRLRYLLEEGKGLIEVQDEFKNFLQFKDDGIYHSKGTSVRFERDTEGRIIKIFNLEGNFFRYDYDVNGDLVAVTNPAGETTRYGYNEHRLVTITSPDGKVILTNTYQDSRLVQQIDANGNVIGVMLNLAARTEKIRDPRGNVTEAKYDENGNVVEVVDALGASTKYEYDENFRVSKVTDALGRVTTTKYNKKGELTERVNALGHKRTFEYIETISARNIISSKRTNVVDERGSVATAVQNYQARSIAQKSAEGIVTSTILNHLGLPVFTQDGEKTMMQYFYDGAGNPAGMGYLFSDEAENKPDLTIVNRPDGKIQQVETGNQKLDITYDSAGRPIKLTNAEGGVTIFTYDANGQTKTLTDPVGNTSTFNYDNDGNLIEEVDTRGKSLRYVYDANGNRIRSTDRNGRVREYRYDALNRLVEERWLDGSTVVETATFGYDAAGQRTFEQNSAGRYEYTYDALGRVQTVKNSGFQNIPDVTLTYTYDEVGNPVSVSDTLGTEVLSIYDRDNRLITRAWLRNGVEAIEFEMRYNGRGQITEIRRRRGRASRSEVGATMQEYTSEGYLKSIRHVDGLGQSFKELGYEYNTIGQLLRTARNGEQSQYSYDKTGQLIGLDNTSLPDEKYSYDRNGNRTMPGYVTTSGNRLLESPDFTFVYDDEGNVVSRFDKSTNRTWTYSYDHGNRMRAAVEKNSNGVVTNELTFIYDVKGRRVGKESKNGESYLTVYNGDNAWIDFDQVGAASVRYLFGDTIDEILARERVSDGLATYVSGKLGSIEDVVEVDSGLRAEYGYKGFGESRVGGSVGVADRFRFTGREWDEESGLGYYRARYYDPGIGRFVSEDPIRIEGGDGNFYRYVGNGLTLFSDNTGKSISFDYAVGITKGVALMSLVETAIRYRTCGSESTTLKGLSLGYSVSFAKNLFSVVAFIMKMPISSVAGVGVGVSGSWVICGAFREN
jgi:RHS repeat-associated protein